MFVARKPKLNTVESIKVTKAKIVDNGSNNQFLTIVGIDDQSTPVQVSVYIGLDSIKEMYYSQIFCQLGLYGEVNESKICDYLKDQTIKVMATKKEVIDPLTQEKTERTQYSFDID